MILLIDNYDSFVYNLARYFQRLGQSTRVVRNDSISLLEIEDAKPHAIVISPGPCGPDESGISLSIIRRFKNRIPILGICLGHQVIAQSFGAKIVRAETPVHGRTSPVFHNSHNVFENLKSPLDACRYHSLIVDKDQLPPELEVTAWTDDGTIMGIQHREYPLVGLQFHPESILSDPGYDLLRNFLRLCDLENVDDATGREVTIADEFKQVESFS